MERHCPNWKAHQMPDFLDEKEMADEECVSCRRRRHPSGLSVHVMAELARHGWVLSPGEPRTRYEGTFPIGAQPTPAVGLPCVYTLYNAERVVSYVGRSENPRKRMTQHWQKGTKKPHLHSWEVVVCSTPRHMVEFEAALIARLKPYLNVTSEVRSNRPWHG